MHRTTHLHSFRFYYPKEEVRIITLISHYSREVKLENERFLNKHPFDDKFTFGSIFCFTVRLNRSRNKAQRKCYYLKLFTHSPPHTQHFKAVLNSMKTWSPAVLLWQHKYPPNANGLEEHNGESNILALKCMSKCGAIFSLKYLKQLT